MTRHAIEAHLDALHAKIPRRWWMPYAFLGGAFVLGLVLSRLPLLKVVSTGARTVQTGITVAGTAASLQRFFADWRNGHRSGPPSGGQPQTKSG